MSRWGEGRKARVYDFVRENVKLADRVPCKVTCSAATAGLGRSRPHPGQR